MLRRIREFHATRVEKRLAAAIPKLEKGPKAKDQKTKRKTKIRSSIFRPNSSCIAIESVCGTVQPSLTLTLTQEEEDAKLLSPSSSIFINNDNNTDSNFNFSNLILSSSLNGSPLTKSLQSYDDKHHVNIRTDAVEQRAVHEQTIEYMKEIIKESDEWHEKEMFDMEGAMAILKEHLKEIVEKDESEILRTQIQFAFCHESLQEKTTELEESQRVYTLYANEIHNLKSKLKHNEEKLWQTHLFLQETRECMERTQRTHSQQQQGSTKALMDLKAHLVSKVTEIQSTLQLTQECLMAVMASIDIQKQIHVRELSKIHTELDSKTTTILQLQSALKEIEQAHYDTKVELLSHKQTIDEKNIQIADMETTLKLQLGKRPGQAFVSLLQLGTSLLKNN